MSTKAFRILVALCGILGITALMVSFAINPAPPAGSAIPQIVVWGKQHETLILTGSWLQGVGSLLEVIFILALVHLTDTTRLLRGWIVMFTATIIMGVSLVEVAFYISTIESGVSGDLTTMSVSLNLIKAIQHAYVIAPAPALLFTLAVILIDSRMLPRLFGYLAVVLGATMGILGLIGTFIPLQLVIDTVLSVQEIWFIAIAITLIITAKAASNVMPANEQVSLTAHG